MDDLAQRFFAWLVKFAVVSLALLIGAHLLGRWLRARRKAPPPPAADAPPKDRS